MDIYIYTYIYTVYIYCIYILYIYIVYIYTVYIYIVYIYTVYIHMIYCKFVPFPIHVYVYHKPNIQATEPNQDASWGQHIASTWLCIMYT